MLDNIDLKEIQQKLYDRLKPTGWADKLKGFILSDDFYKILTVLLIEAQDGKRFTPLIKQLFRAFEECPFDSLKVVILGQDPYPYKDVADGIAFSCSNDKVIQPSLRYMFKEIETTVYPGVTYTRDPDLTRWANQGVLLINTAFTTTINQIGSHYILWQPFLAYLFDTLNFGSPGLVYVFMGKKAQEWSHSIPENNHRINTMHPAAAAHNKDESWDSGDVFNKINNHLTTKIIW
jgi:uracil-DNA glycosylase